MPKFSSTCASITSWFAMLLASMMLIGSSCPASTKRFTLLARASGDGGIAETVRCCFVGADALAIIVSLFSGVTSVSPNTSALAASSVVSFGSCTDDKASASSNTEDAVYDFVRADVGPFSNAIAAFTTSVKSALDTFDLPTA